MGLQERLSLIVTLILTRGVALALPCLWRYDVSMICINYTILLVVNLPSKF